MKPLTPRGPAVTYCLYGDLYCATNDRRYKPTQISPICRPGCNKFSHFRCALELRRDPVPKYGVVSRGRQIGPKLNMTDCE